MHVNPETFTKGIENIKIVEKQSNDSVLDKKKKKVKEAKS